MILGATNQKLWVFEGFRRSLGRVGMCWSQLARVDHMRKKVEGRRKKNFKKKRIEPDRPSIDPRSAGDHWSPTSPG
jgi:hypothetical protein